MKSNFKELSYFIISLLLISGCSILKNLDEASTKKFNNNSSAKDFVNENKLFCQVPDTKYQLITEDIETLEFYKSLEKSILKNSKYSFIDKAIMISLIELVRRPDQMGPHSRFQFYIKYDKKNYYYDFRAKDLKLESPQPFIVAIEFLAKKFQKNNSLFKLTSDLDVLVPKDIFVSYDLAAVLKENSKQLIKNDLFYERFFKGDEVITKYETFQRDSFKNITNIKTKSKNINFYDYDSNALFTSKGIYKCNFNINDEITYLKNDNNHEMRKSHTIGFVQENNVFLAVASFEIDPSYVNQFTNLNYFSAKAPQDAYPFCFIDQNAKEFALFSNKDRNPEQFMQHLLSYEIEKSSDQLETNQILNFSRHLVLSTPDRILYESKKGRKSQLNFFLAMNFPVYHAESLGNIFGYSSIKKLQNNTPILHIDMRNQGHLWCSK